MQFLRQHRSIPRRIGVASAALLASALPALAQTAAPFQMLPSDMANYVAGAAVPGPFVVTQADVVATTRYSGASDAGAAQITSNPNETLVFEDASTAGTAAITNNTGGATRFYEGSSAAGAVIANNGTLQFSDQASAGTATITNNAAGAVVFAGQATGGAANLENSGTMVFTDTASSAGANLTNNTTGELHFAGGSTSGKGITNNGLTVYSDTASVGGGFVTNNLGGRILFRDSAQAGSNALTNSGTLAFAGNSSASTAGIVNNASGTVVFLGNADAAQSVINNGGVLYFTGSSTANSAVILTQTGGATVFSDTASGGIAEMRLDNGALLDFSQLTSGATSVGSLLGTGTVALGGTALTVGGNNLATTVSGIIDGGIGGGTGGSLIKVGTGTLRLDGSNTYTGRTEVLAGVLQAANANSFAPLSAVLVAQGALLDIAGSDQTIGSLAGAGQVELAANVLTLGGNNSSTTFSGQLLAAGGITKVGTGIFTLSGASSNFGATTVNAGTLQVDGSIALSAVTVNGGVLAGGGSVGATTISAAGTLAPGGGRTLSVGGDLLLASGATLQLDLANGVMSQVAVAGVADIDGSTLALGNVRGFDPNASYVILVATGGVNGTFAPPSSDFAFVVPTISYDPNSIRLSLTRNGLDFADLALTPNQRAAANAVEAAGTTDPIFQAVVMADATTALSAFDQLTGELHAEIGPVLLRQSAAIPRMALARLDDEDGAWLVGWGERGSLRGADVHGADYGLGGLAAGAETTIDGVGRIGLLVGASQSRITTPGLAGSARADLLHLAVYGSTKLGQINLKAGASLSGGTINTERSVAFAAINDTNRASYNASIIQVFGEAGYPIRIEDVTLEPFGRLQAAWLNTSGFAETGGVTAMSGAPNSVTAVQSTIGLRASTVIGPAEQPIKASGMIGWQHSWSGDNSIDVALPGGPDYVIGGASLGRDAMVAEVGLSMDVNPLTTISLALSGSVSEAGFEQAVRFSIVGRF